LRFLLLVLSLASAALDPDRDDPLRPHSEALCIRALEKYDVPAPVHRHLPPLCVCHVSIIACRPLWAAFITKELRELTDLAGATMLPLALEFSRSAIPDAKFTRRHLLRHMDLAVAYIDPRPCVCGVLASTMLDAYGRDPGRPPLWRCW
jgi:hypothetical protein